MCGRFRAVASLLLAAVCCGVVGIARGHDQVPGAPQSAPVLLRGGDLYTVSHGVLEGTDLLFRAGKIERIARDIEPPAGAEVVDVSGRRVYPGLIAPYSTLGLTEIGAVRATDDRIEVGSVTPEISARVAFNPDSELIPTVRSHGITTAQIAPLGSLVRGRSFLAQLDGWTHEDSTLRAEDGLHIAWPSAVISRGSGTKQSREEQQKRIDEQHRLLRDTFDAARDYRLARDADPEGPIDLRWEALGPFVRGELPVYVAADDYRQIVEAVAFAREYDLRLILIGGKDAYKLTDLLASHEIPVMVGSVLSLPLRQDDAYDSTFRLPAILHEAGVKFCLVHVAWGAWDVRNLPFQAGQAVAFGLPRDVALRALTLSAAEILGIADRQGSLDVGKDATLFVSTGDVMDTLSQEVTHMFIEGRRVDLDDRHERLYRKYRQRTPTPVARRVPLGRSGP